MRMQIKEYLKEHRLITDGAMGTYYRHLYAGDGTTAEEANLICPERIRNIHRAYIEQGAELIRLNTFALNRPTVTQFKNVETDLDDYIEQSIRAAAALGQQAVKESGQHVFLAASIGPVPMRENEDSGRYFVGKRCAGETGQAHLETARSDISLRGTTDLTAPDAAKSSQEEAYPGEREYKRNIDIFLEEGIDIFFLETFSDVEPVRRMAGYIKERCPQAFVLGQFSIQPTGYSQMGKSVERIFLEAGQIEALDAVGLNCNIGVAHMYKYLNRVEFPSDKYISALPNCGYPHIVRGMPVYSDSISYYGEGMEKIASLGVNILGGCCGTTPAYIGEIAGRLKKTAPAERAVRHRRQGDAVCQEPVYPLIEKMKAGEKVVAVELDPPFDEKVTKLMEGAFYLKEKGADLITIADSPMGRSRADSLLVSAKLQRDVGITVLPHMTCRDRNRIGVRSSILGAYINEIRNLLIVTGDPVGVGDRDNTKGVFDFNSIRMMELVRQMNEEHFLSEPICVGAALNQNAVSVDAMIGRMQKKIEAGASFFLTQPVYDEQSIERIRMAKEKLNTRILCGIMPLVSYRNASFIKNEMPGICVPDEVLRRYHPMQTKEEAEDVAVDVCLELMQQMRDVADGWYFMTPFNRVSLIGRLIEGERRMHPRTRTGQSPV